MVAALQNIPQAKLSDFCARPGVAELSVFGSALRDDFDSESDVDVLFVLKPEETMSIEKYLEMRDELSEMFGGREVDLVQKRLLKNPFRRAEILRTRKVLYAA